ncbi:MAG: Nif3-like dinuclear metal center hexameric protein [Deltaproteobacteria bacterium]|nr:Nif3-like dinuclear metal center hexameric protein [Deltaproteobacteria bacterium]
MLSPRAALWEALQRLCPLHLAGAWDQVGALIDPPRLGGDARGAGGARGERLFLTIDLTEPVFEEAAAWGATVILAYHPLLFHPLRRLDARSAISRVALRAVQAGVAVYSPHSALDAVAGGVCDWLAGAFEPFGVRDLRPLEPCAASPAEGAGRSLRLERPQPLPALLGAIQGLLRLPYLRVAASEDLRAGGLVERVALCPGAGGGLFEGLPHAAEGGPQLLLTGELRHHEVLARVREGGAVALTEHTRCERGYLPLLAARLRAALPVGLCESVEVSRVDEDPLSLYAAPAPLAALGGGR